MPISRSALDGETRTCTLEYHGESLDVVYRPDALTPGDLKLAKAFQDDADAVVDMLAKQLVSWDVLEEDGSAVPTDAETLSTLGLAFLGSVFRQLQAHIGEAVQQEGKVSANGSRPMGS